MRKKIVRNIRSLVVKVGTSVLTADGRFDKKIIADLSRQVSGFLSRGIRVTIVSSGAIGAGMTILKLRERPKTMEGLQAAAAIGQRFLMQCYEEAFAKHGFTTAQILLTWDDLAERTRYMNAKKTLAQIQRIGAVPIINENDTVATEEIRFGDNDRLSSLMAILAEADCLVILSDTNGLYQDGRRDEESHRIKIVEAVKGSTYSHAKDQKTRFTVGGMKAKLQAIHTAVSSGVPVFLAHGRHANVLERLFQGEDLGTLFLPHLRRQTNKEWVLHFERAIKERRAIKL